MTFTALGSHWLWPSGGVNSPSAANILLDANGEKAGTVFRPPKAGTFDTVYFRTGTVTIGDTLDIRMETVDATTGDPSGTLWATNTNNTQAVAATDDNTWFPVTLTAGAVITDPSVPIALVIVNGTLGNLNIAAGSPLGNCLADTRPVTNYGDNFQGGAWAKISQPLQMAARYSDTSHVPIPGISPYVSGLNTNFNSATNPNERGNRFVMPFTARCVGVWFYVSKVANNPTLRLYDGGGASDLTVLESAVVDLDTTSGDGYITALFDTSVTLTAGNVYRVAIAPDAGAVIAPREASVVSTTLADAAIGGVSTYKSTRNGGNWTDTATARYNAGPVIDAIDLSGGGVGAGRSMPRGMVA